MPKRRFTGRRSGIDGGRSLSDVMQTLALVMAIGSLLVTVSFVAFQAYDHWLRR